MKFLTRCLPEPDLEFGDGGRHLDPRYGLMTYGPLQPKLGDLVRIGVIGTSDTVEGVKGFMARAMAGIPGVNERLVLRGDQGENSATIRMRMDRVAVT